MATLTSQLVISLINRVTAPARAINSSLDSLRQKSARNAVQMRAAQTDMLGAAAVAYGLAKAIASPVKVAANFEASMNRVTALSGASGEQFDKLRQQALNLGRTTQFTASQAGDAMGFLAMAGFQLLVEYLRMETTMTSTCTISNQNKAESLKTFAWNCHQMTNCCF